ncbi:MAG TPA: hypothetical protein VGG28_05040 [Kofleriaceae bacterium]
MRVPVVDAAAIDPPDAAIDRIPSDVPEVAFVTISSPASDAQDVTHTHVQFAKTTSHGVVITRSVDVAGVITTLAWVSGDPVVMLENGDVGHISARGYERYAVVPAARWRVAKPPDPSAEQPTEAFEPPHWRMLASTDGAVWQARCDWGWDLPHGIAHHCVPEGGECRAWVFARVSPGPLQIVRTQPQAAFDSEEPSDSATTPLPAVAASTAIHAGLVDVPVPDDRDHQHTVLRCTDGTATTQYPTDDDLDLRNANYDSVTDLTWLSTTPPIVAVRRQFGCLDHEWVVFERCAMSNDLSAAALSGGPHDLLAIATSNQLLLRWHDHALGALDDVAKFAFAP